MQDLTHFLEHFNMRIIASFNHFSYDRKPMDTLTKLPEWQALAHHYNEIKDQHMRDWFLQDPLRFTRFSLEHAGILLDYSRNRITPETIRLLFALANATHLADKIEALFQGAKINCTEKRAALHTALRDQSKISEIVNQHAVSQQVATSLHMMRTFVQSFRDQSIKGVTGKPLDTIVTIGIGGSQLGPMICQDALMDYAAKSLRSYYLSTVDQASIQDVINQINPEKTLIIVSSKTFSTLETLTNAHTIRSFMQSRLGDQVLSKQFAAVTAAPDKALQFGIHSSRIFPLWEWVGGRYSVWSTVGLPLALMIGNQHFAEFLEGAFLMDQHFRHTDFASNIPVLLALLSIWTINFFGAKAQAIAPYSYRLRDFTAYLQQAEMESNGKCVSLNGERIEYETSPVTFGREGCNGQHAYHQLLHQGQQLIPVDFILVGKHTSDHFDHLHDILIASGLSQAQALMRGKTYEEAYRSLLSAHYPPEEAAYLAHHHMIPGNKPSNILFLKTLCPKTLGALLALYEHKIFVQGAIWGINSFDQFGVELGKQLLPKILHNLQHTSDPSELDCATLGIIAHYKNLKTKGE